MAEQQYATGGYVDGSDVPTWRHPHEHFWTAEQVRKAGGFVALGLLRDAERQRREADNA